jgi:hypothetical protein
MKKLNDLLQTVNLKELIQLRCKRFLSKKIDITAFMVWFIENYPVSVKILKENPDYQLGFK